jgi:ABC-type antimicrobial peptide transport system permease subunit
MRHTLYLDHIENAYNSLRRNRGRTILTTLGITIGITSITCILALSGGVSKMIYQQIDAYSNNLSVIRPGLQTRDPNALINPVAQQSFSTSSLTEQDVDLIADLPGVDSVAPLMTVNGTLKSKSETVEDNVVLATTPIFEKLSGLTMKSGQFLDEVTDNNTAVVGEQLAIDLFGTDRPISSTFTIRGQTFTVIGVIKNSANPINYNNVDLNHAAVVSFAQGKLFHQSRAQIQQIDVLSKPGTSTDTMNKAIHKTLLTSHLGEKDFSVVSGKDIGTPTNELFKAMTAVMTAIAAISLVVGGIGIMNIMLVGVAERTREIGIRKAVGASNGDIVIQFLMESLIISFLGGLLGYFSGYVLAFAVSTFLYFPPVFSWTIAAISVGMAMVVGIIFGIYPASRAARKDTIESLRQYH